MGADELDGASSWGIAYCTQKRESLSRRSLWTRRPYWKTAPPVERADMATLSERQRVSVDPLNRNGIQPTRTRPNSDAVALHLYARRLCSGLLRVGRRLKRSRRSG